MQMFDAASRHSAHKPLHFVGMDKRDADGPAAGSLGAPELALDLVEIELGELWIGGEAVSGLVARMAAGAAGDLEPSAVVEIRELEISLPVHQKSSAEGMRV